ncbi:MAG: hypothetical protein CVV42_10765 [Candidatus Riflebacteria bacterium HGW-Riflebacteria-2]|jgi:hypothetical protein|nr:MAG: hypothetical protein CVV42_10765 [Candidatus Riflebacteria bacterium HGW-Riflebacteria-2]
MKPYAKIIIMLALALITAQAFAITSSEIYSDGTRAFNSARWQEAEEIFTRFIDTWPDHMLKSKALYYKTIASTRNVTSSINKTMSENAITWKAEMAKLQVDLPGTDLTELQVAIDIANRHNEEPDWQSLSQLKPIELKHYLQRGWHPDAAVEPMATLAWSNDWLKNNTSGLDPDLESRIQLLRARAFWQLSLSPLSLSANSVILKIWKCWPVHEHLQTALDRGFTTGDPEIKRQIALLGYHFDVFKDRGLLDTGPDNLKSRWYSYLSQRGINHQEAWCPR